MRFKEIRTEHGQTLVVNAHDIVVLEPKDKTWDTGGIVWLREGSCRYTNLFIDAAQAQAIRTWLMAV
ncbi:hypothetical protein L3X14_06075 [Pseudomonas balearica]|jgi:hypothetical protein|uniref:hypothetical protein n=1 Tax=Stutzerimonas balearica TaxID=74829 RepID=UPI001F165AB8|nr:hypothetical protein [Stutzerimonas balearica]MCF6756158.1 hypothetical protein [Stutzerimonas balearica]